MEDGQPKRIGGKVVRGAPIPVTTVEFKVLTGAEAMDASVFASAISPTGEPSRDSRIITFALCALQKVNNETILRPTTLDEFMALRDRFDASELMALGRAHLEFSDAVEGDDDPKEESAGPK